MRRGLTLTELLTVLAIAAVIVAGVALLGRGVRSASEAQHEKIFENVREVLRDLENL